LITAKRRRGASVNDGGGIQNGTQKVTRALKKRKHSKNEKKKSKGGGTGMEKPRFRKGTRELQVEKKGGRKGESSKTKKRTRRENVWGSARRPN